MFETLRDLSKIKMTIVTNITVVAFKSLFQSRVIKSAVLSIYSHSLTGLLALHKHLQESLDYEQSIANS